MPVTFVSAATLGSVAANPPTFNITIGAITENDIIIVEVMSKNIVEASNEIAVPTSSQGTFTEKGTKTEIDNATAADDMRTAMYYLRSPGGSPTDTVTVSRAGTDTLGLYAVLSIWRGVVTSGDPFDTTGIVINGNNTAGDIIAESAFNPTAAAVHVIYSGWKADDSTTALANFVNDGTTFTIRNDQETITGSDATHGIWSANRNTNALGAINITCIGTDGTSIGYVYALLPAPVAVTADAGSYTVAGTDATLTKTDVAPVITRPTMPIFRNPVLAGPKGVNLQPAAQSALAMPPMRPPTG